MTSTKMSAYITQVLMDMMDLKNLLDSVSTTESRDIFIQNWRRENANSEATVKSTTGDWPEAYPDVMGIQIAPNRVFKTFEYQGKCIELSVYLESESEK